MFDLKNLPVGDDPKKILKMILGLAAIFLVLWVFVLAQSNQYDTSSSGTNGIVNTDSLNLSLTPQMRQTSAKQGGSVFLHTLPVLLFLTVVIFLLWYWQKKGGADKKSDLFEVVGRQQLGVGQQIVVMFINEEYWVLAISGKEISLLEKYAKEDWKGPEVGSRLSSNKFMKIFSEKQQKYAR